MCPRRGKRPHGHGVQAQRSKFHACIYVTDQDGKVKQCNLGRWVDVAQAQRAHDVAATWINKKEGKKLKKLNHDDGRYAGGEYAEYWNMELDGLVAALHEEAGAAGKRRGEHGIGVRARGNKFQPYIQVQPSRIIQYLGMWHDVAQAQRARDVAATWINKKEGKELKLNKTDGRYAGGEYDKYWIMEWDGLVAALSEEAGSAHKERKKEAPIPL